MWGYFLLYVLKSVIKVGCEWVLLSPGGLKKIVNVIATMFDVDGGSDRLARLAYESINPEYTPQIKNEDIFLFERGEHCKIPVFYKRPHTIFCLITTIQTVL